MDNSHHESEDFRRLLDFLADQRLLDFSAYTPDMLRRQLAGRLVACELPDYGAYRDFLVGHPDEVDRLAESLAITVSHFFRNPLTFALLGERIIPALFARADAGGLRVWCAGCGQGEEAYSLAMCIDNHRRREKLHTPVLVLATDINQPSLEWAAQGWYRAEALEEVRKRDLEHHFVPERGGYRISEAIRSLVTFARHDVTSALAPAAGIFADYQLILCRNVLIYFSLAHNTRTQEQLVARLSPGGYLVRGEAEAVAPSLTEIMQEVLPGSHIFRKQEAHHG